MRRWIVASVVLLVLAVATAVLVWLNRTTTTGVRSRNVVLTGDDRSDSILVSCGNRGMVKVNHSRPDDGAVRA